jgi:hypothetical protein
VSITCPTCDAATYVSLPTGNRFVTAEPGEGDDDRPGRERVEATCDACETAFPVVHAPRRD